MDCMEQWEMHICARHDTCDLITSDAFKLLKLSFEKDGSVKTLNERTALMARMDRNWRSLGFPDAPQLPDAFRFLSYFAPKPSHAMRQDRVMFNNQVDVSGVTLASLVQSGEDYMRNLSRHAKEYDKSFTETVDTYNECYYIL